MNVKLMSSLNTEMVHPIALKPLDILINYKIIKRGFLGKNLQTQCGLYPCIEIKITMLF